MTNKTSITTYLSSESVRNNIEQTLGKKTQQFIANVASLVSSNKTLQECDYSSILQACLVATNMDLSINPNLGLAAVIPYKDKTGQQYAQFQIMKKGYIQLALRTGKFVTINASNVKDGEYKGINRLTGDIAWEWQDDQDKREKLPTIGYVAYFKTRDGFEKTLYMTNEELKQHGLRYSSSFKRGYGNWVDSFDDMAEKTVIKLLISRWGLLSTELETAQITDQAVLDEDGNARYVDNEIASPAEQAREKEVQRVRNHIEKSTTLEELEQCREHLTEETELLFSNKFDLLANIDNEDKKETKKGKNGK